MNILFSRRIFALALSVYLAVTLFAAFSPARTTHAATAHAAGCANHDMGRGTTWNPGQSTSWTTCSGFPIRLTYQTDGNFVLYINNTPQWNSGSNDVTAAPYYVQFQTDGNLVVYGKLRINNSRRSQWASNTPNQGATTLALQGDGNLVIYTSSGHALWASNTCCWT